MNKLIGLFKTPNIAKALTGVIYIYSQLPISQTRK